MLIDTVNPSSRTSQQIAEKGAGAVVIRIPKPRQGSYCSRFLKPRMAEKALTTVIQETESV